MAEDKIQTIETTLAHHEMQIQDLSDMINMQWKEIQRLKSQIEKAHAKISEIESSDSEGEPQSVAEIAASEKPPHY